MRVGFRSKWFVLPSILLVLALVVACGPGPTPTLAPTPGATPTPAPKVPFVKVGVLLPLSGANAETGKMIKEGIEFINDQILEQGGIKSLGGAPIRLVYADVASDPKTAGAEMERLATKEKVSLVLGPYSSGETGGAAPVAERTQVPELSVRSTADDVYPLNLTYWRTIGVPSSQYWVGAARAIYDLRDEYGLKMDKIAFVGDNLKVIQLIVTGAKIVIKEKGDEGKVVADLTYDAAAVDLTPVASKLKAAAPDVQFGPAYFGSGVILLRSMDAVGWYPRLQVMTDTLVSPKAVDALGKELGIKMTRRPGILFNGYFSEKVALPQIKDFVARAEPWMKAKGFPVLEVDFVMGAQGMLLAQKVLELAGSTDPKAINEAFRKLKVPQTDPAFIIPAFAPEINWEPNGRMVNANFLMEQWQEKDGKWGIEVIWPKSLRTAEFLFPPEAKK